MAKYAERVLSLLSLFYLAHADSSTGCDNGWVPYNNNCYLINTIKSVTRKAAAQECNSQDSSLLRITSQDQLTWLKTTLKQYPSSGYWTDLNDIPKVVANRLGTGVWKWGMYEYANMSLIRWNQSPANDGQSTCGAVNIQGKLADLNCKANEGYICQYPSSGGCVLGWLQGTDSCYYVANTSDPSALKTWAQAKTFCESMGGGAVNPKMMIIDDQNDVTFLSGEIPYLSQTTKVHWVGLQQNTGGSWGWYTGANLDTSVISWQKEPDNVAGIENCGVLRMTGVFSDRDCSSNANFICTKPQYNTAPTDNMGCGSWIRAGKFCYSFMAGKMRNTWAGGRSYCQSMGADLMKVDTFDKKTWLEQQLIDPANNLAYWTGLNDQQNEGNYVWADGSSVNQTYIKWNQEPNDYKGFEDCAVIYTTGQYNDISCSYHAAAICELDNQATCKPGWKSNGGNCYLFTPYNNISVLYNQNEASTFCATFASSKTNVGSLLSVDNMNEKAFIISQVGAMSNNVYGWWTSLNDKQNEGYWAFNTNPLLNPKLIDWGGEPSTKPGDNCGMVIYGGNFHERNCSRRIPYICERYATGYSTGVSLKGSIVASLILLLASRIF
ncbi:macrophage mannose receptor 1-like [Ruditapes philippinarum]|uniref:macrophage mannose receptor 1-like n=1 Tax=Ruditapes philippinarum TaxID=129788 RepID=UPI00295A6395|nr:macrophage mannose receptor 1-like [Ruditapes philippinarum]